MSSEEKSAAIELPSTISDWLEKVGPHLADVPNIKLLTPSLEAVKQALPPDVQPLFHFCGSAAIHGRPLDKVVLMLFGKSGSGKTSTLNRLFGAGVIPVDDDNLFSDTKVVTEYSIPLESSVRATLVVTDTPGTDDTDHVQDNLNQAALDSYAAHCPHFKTQLPSSIQLGSASVSLSTKVYPNLILLVTDSRDHRAGGLRSGFGKSVQRLAALGLVDKARCNVVVVATHAKDPDGIPSWPTRMLNLERALQHTVNSFLNIPNVKVVFVENGPSNKDFLTAMPVLHNGERSPFNLFDTIRIHLQNNRDYLGLLLTSQFFAADKQFKAPEERPYDLPEHVRAKIISEGDYAPPEPFLTTEVARVIETVHGRDAYTDLKHRLYKSELRSLVSLKDQPISVVENYQVLSEPELAVLKREFKMKDVPRWVHTSVGAFYDPILGIRKPGFFYSGAEFAIQDLAGRRFLVPKYLQSQDRSEWKSHVFIFESKEEYDRSRQFTLGLDVKAKLVTEGVNADIHFSNEKESKDSASNSAQCFTVERRLVENYVKRELHALNPALEQDMKFLPEVFDGKSANHFRAFFARWGSHYISFDATGAAIHGKFSSKVASSSHSDRQKLESELSASFSKLSVEAKVSHESSESSSSSTLMENSSLRMEGGCAMAPKTFKDLSPQEFKVWHDSIPSNMLSLEDSFRLEPLYLLLNLGPQQTALQEATDAYCSGDALFRAAKIEVKTEMQRMTDEELRNAKSVDGVKQAEECFSPFSTVQLEDGTSKPLAKLQIGDRVMSVGARGTPEFSPIVRVRRHAHPTTGCTWSLIEVALQIHSGKHLQLQVTPNHLVYLCEQERSVINASSDTLRLVPILAASLKTGDRLIVCDDTSSKWGVGVIITIAARSSSLVVSPVSMNGRIVVDGVLVSCYGSSGEQIGHRAHIFHRTLFHLHPSLLKVSFVDFVETVATRLWRFLQIMW